MTNSLFNYPVKDLFNAEVTFSHKLTLILTGNSLNSTKDPDQPCVAPLNVTKLIVRGGINLSYDGPSKTPSYDGGGG